MTDLNEATRLRDQKTDLESRVISLRLRGWSHSTCMAYRYDAYEPNPEDPLDLPNARALVYAYAEEVDLYAHGIQPPTQTRVSGRKRHRDVAPFDPYRLYQT